MYSSESVLGLEINQGLNLDQILAAKSQNQVKIEPEI